MEVVFVKFQGFFPCFFVDSNCFLYCTWMSVFLCKYRFNKRQYSR